MIKIGDLLDSTYIVEGQIGAGGSGIIYKAYHCRLEKNVIIKKIKNELRDKINERSEVDILKNLKHMYLPQVYDFIVDGDDVYTVMDYVSGSSLSHELEMRRRFPQKKVIKWGIQLCEALLYLHSREIPIIHSDIKPGNIMLTPEDNICLIDFNISLMLSRNDNVIGFSQGYSSPEQISSFNVLNRMAVPIKKSKKASENGFFELNNGDIKAVLSKERCKLDFRSDIYSLGATLYHLVSGERPENSDRAAASLDSYNIKIGHSLKKIIHKAMDKERERRYKSAEDMLHDLNNIDKNDYLYDKKRKTKRKLMIFLSAAGIFVLVLLFILNIDLRLY